MTSGPDVERLRRLLADASSQPWRRSTVDDWDVRSATHYPVARHVDNDDADLIVAAVNALPSLLAEVDRLTAALAEAREQAARAERVEDMAREANAAAIKALNTVDRMRPVVEAAVQVVEIMRDLDEEHNATGWDAALDELDERIDTYRRAPEPEETP